jgi:hypothetical protein
MPYCSSTKMMIDHYDRRHGTAPHPPTYCFFFAVM